MRITFDGQTKEDTSNEMDKTDGKVKELKLLLISLGEKDFATVQPTPHGSATGRDCIYSGDNPFSVGGHCVLAKTTLFAAERGKTYWRAFSIVLLFRSIQASM